MLGAIAGDMAGSCYEFSGMKEKAFPFFHPKSHFTDDTVMTIAVGSALAATGGDPQTFPARLIQEMQALGRLYPHAGYGGRFSRWLRTPNPKPYGSFGNGSAMRVSPVGLWAESLEEALELARLSAAVTHDHPEGIRGAQAVAGCIFLAKTGSSKADIQAWVRAQFYPLDRTLAEIRPDYDFDVTCQGSVPEAIQAFLEADSTEDAIRNAVSLGGDADTQGAIAGSIGEAFYGVPEDLRQQVFARLDDRLRDGVTAFYEAMDRRGSAPM